MVILQICLKPSARLVFRQYPPLYSTADVYVPKVYRELCSRRVLVTEWVDGVKLTQCSPEEIRDLIVIGQEAFLHQCEPDSRLALVRRTDTGSSPRLVPDSIRSASGLI